jgi:hypothetical protein
MNISEHDKIEAVKISEIINKINRIDNDYFHVITDEMNQYQPFLLSILLGYRYDLKPEEHGEIIKTIFIIWEYFRENKNIRHKKLTEKHFERILKRNLGMLKYLEGESDPAELHNITGSDLDHLKSKALLSGIFFMFDTQSSLVKMDITTKGTILIGLKSVIECFEEIGN